jgi:hypothetical protein
MSHGIEVIVYADDCIVSGAVELTAGRLTDQLNNGETLVVTEPNVRALADDSTLELASIAIAVDEICLVEGGGPRGQIDRRVRRIPERVSIDVGPYRLTGDIHAVVGTRAASSILRRDRLIPITAVTIEMTVGGQRIERQADLVVVNRDRIAHLDEVFPTQSVEKADEASLAASA